jgi:hypothetical protein
MDFAARAKELAQEKREEIRQEASAKKYLEERTIEVSDAISSYLSTIGKTDTVISRSGADINLQRDKVNLVVTVKADGRYSAKQNSGSFIDDVPLNIKNENLDERRMMDTVIDWLAKA